MRTKQTKKKTTRNVPKVSRALSMQLDIPTWSVPKGISPANTTAYLTSKRYITNLSSSSAADVVGAISFKLNDCLDSTSYINMYDQYCIYKIEIFGFMTDLLPGAASPTNTVFITAIDIDDATTPSSTDALLNYSSSMIHGLGRKWKRSFKPRCSGVVYSGGTASGNVVNGPTWIDVATPAVEHYGFKYGWKQATTTNNSNVFMFAKYYVILKRSR